MMRPPKQETFEDAQDTASVRSLTGRKASVAGQPAVQSKSELEEAFKKIRGRSGATAAEQEKPKVTSADEKQQQQQQQDKQPNGQRKSSAISIHRISDNSNDQLDSVSLDDEAAAAAAANAKGQFLLIH